MKVKVFFSQTRSEPGVSLYTKLMENFFQTGFSRFQFRKGKANILFALNGQEIATHVMSNAFVPP